MKCFFCLVLLSILIANSYTLFASTHITNFPLERGYLSDSIPNKINKRFGIIFHSLEDKFNILDYNHLIQTPKQERGILTQKNKFIDSSFYRHYSNLTSIIKRNLPPPRDFELIKDWAGKNCSLWVSINLSIDMLY